jgi:hypothetical protein
MMWEACAARNPAMGGEVLLGRRVEECRFEAAGRWEVRAEDRRPAKRKRDPPIM